MSDVAGTVTSTGVIHLSDGRRTFGAGHVASTRHGAHSLRVVAPVAEEIETALEAMVAGTPADAPSFAAARGTLAVKLARLAKVREFIDSTNAGSPLDASGDPLAAAKLESELLASVESSLAALGLTPMAASKLGVNLVRGEALLAAREDLDEGRRLRLARDAREQGGDECA